VRLAAAQEIGNGGDEAYAEMAEAWEEEAASEGAHSSVMGRIPDWRNWSRAVAGPGGEDHQRKCALRGWILPMLVGSTRRRRKDADERLQDWMKGVGYESGPSMPLSVEAALAQGFKHAANRRPHHAHENADSRAVLQSHAASMIFNAEFWYSRLTLLHALCLWQLSRIVYPGHAGHDMSDRPRDPSALVGRWLRRPKGKQEEHPFVVQAADLVLDAIEKRQPERFIWIDESGVVTKIGSRSKRHHEAQGRRSLWIAPSAGWVALDSRAQRLVADVLILLNLAERGDVAERREQRLVATNQGKLPLCLTDERCSHLKPSQTVGMADIPNPGEDCKAHCPVALCPYPPRGQQAYRVELSEAFCRRQQVIWGRLGPWQEAPRSELRRFWSEMEDRART
jgi:hypothetical protein